MSSSPVFERNGSSKKWREMYQEKLNGGVVRKKKHHLPAIKQVPIATSKSSTAVITKIPTSPRLIPIDVTKPLLKHAEWNPHWGTQSLCYHCGKPALSSILLCKMCNAVIHTNCLNSTSSSQTMNLHFSKIANLDGYVCSNCQDFIIDDHAKFNQQKELHYRKKVKDECAVLIARRVVIFLEKRRLRRKIAAIILVQSQFRRHIAQRSFDNYRRSKLRTLVLELVTLPPRVVENGLVVFSALDTFTNSQLMRVDKKGDVALRESFLIPGVTTQMTLYLTLAVKDEGASGNSPLQYSIILQGQICLRDLPGYFEKQVISLTYIDKIQLVPVEICGSGHAKNILTVNPNLMQSPLRALPTTDTTDFIGQIRYLPQNPISEMCEVVYAPHLDALRKDGEIVVSKGKRKQNNMAAAQQSTLSQSGPGGMRNYKYWMCLHKARLHLYRFYGDAEPRFFADVSGADAEVLQDKSGQFSFIVSVNHPDNRHWLLEFTSKINASRFALTVNEGRLAKGVPLAGAGAAMSPAGLGAGAGAGGAAVGGLSQSKYIRSSEFKQADLPCGYQHLTMY